MIISRFSHVLVRFSNSFVSGCYKVSEWKMGNVRSFYGKKAQHCEMVSAVNQVEEKNPETPDTVMVRPPLGGQETNLENENDDSLCVDD